MKVLTINGSPHLHGCTDMALLEFESSMPIVSSTYWNEVHGFVADDVEKDLEGLQTMRNLARNMAFMIKAFKAQEAKEGIPLQERDSFTSFMDKA